MNRKTIAICFLLLVSAWQTTSAVSAKEPLPTAKPFNLEPYREASVERWSEEIASFEAKDKTEKHSNESILFVGSSSIRRWNDIAADMSPYQPIQRGFGGSRWTDVAVFAERLIRPHQFRAVVFFVANDMTGGDDDRTPEEVAELFHYVLGKVREHDQQAPVFYIAVTPTESRLRVWPQIKAGNMLVRELCQQTDSAYFIGTESIYLDSDGKPRPELFVADKLHLSRDGYIRWAAAIKSQLDTVLGGAKAR